MDKPIVTAHTLLSALLQKHKEKWVCVPECKLGSSWTSGRGGMAMDLWCMAKSWTKPKAICYEIKISRADFLRDEKYREYLDFCNEFYFVAPPGIIDPGELPSESGLLVSSKNGTRLYTKKKAPYRVITVPDSVYRYILMWRTTIEREHERKRDTSEYWKKWLEKKREDRHLGRAVSRKLRQQYQADVDDVRQQQDKLEAEIEKLKYVKEFLKLKGIPIGTKYSLERYLNTMLDEERTGMPNGLKNQINQAFRILESAKESIAAHEKKTST